jgi:heme/copper-type cytochrome/quinol oxidase subunit 2
MGIILIYRNVKDVCRNLGVVFFIYGAIFLAAILVGKNLARHIINTQDIPQAWHPVPGILLNDITSPLQTVSIIALVVGVLLIIVSFVYPRAKQTKEEPAK